MPIAGDALRQLAYSAERLDGNVLAPFDSTSVQLQTGAQSLGALLSQEWRRRKLTQLVIAAHPHVVALCDGLLARVTLLSEPVKSLAELRTTLPAARARVARHRTAHRQ
jgi:hypothetical protein